MYCELVRFWSPRLNLISPEDLGRLEERHIQDSLRVVPLLDVLPPGLCIDVGSGAGLPGVPLAIACPERHWRLLEPRKARAAFLEEIVRELALDEVEVLTLTAEQAASGPLAAAHVLATGRALAAPSKAFDLLLPLVSPAGVALIFLGEGSRLPLLAEEWSEGLAIVRQGSTQGRKDP